MTGHREACDKAYYNNMHLANAMRHSLSTTTTTQLRKEQTSNNDEPSVTSEQAGSKHSIQHAASTRPGVETT